MVRIPQASRSRSVSISCNNVGIKVSKTVKYLGLYLDHAEHVYQHNGNRTSQETKFQNNLFIPVKKSNQIRSNSIIHFRVIPLVCSLLLQAICVNSLLWRNFFCSSSNKLEVAFGFSRHNANCRSDFESNYHFMITYYCRSTIYIYISYIWEGLC